MKTEIQLQSSGNILQKKTIKYGLQNEKKRKIKSEFHEF